MVCPILTLLLSMFLIIGCPYCTNSNSSRDGNDEIDQDFNDAQDGNNNDNCYDIIDIYELCDFWSPTEIWNIAVCNPFDLCCLFDSDGDGIIDMLDNDDDNDGLLDEFEYFMNYVPDGRCYFRDTDEDLRPDALDSDSDADGVCDHLENTMGLDPYNSDTDGDRLSDFAEIWLGFDPLDDRSYFVGQAVSYYILLNGCPDYSSDRRNVFLTVTSDCESARLTMEDSSEAIHGMSGTDCIVAARPASIMPENGGEILESGEVIDLIIASVVTVEIEMYHPSAENCLPCPYFFLVQLELVCTDDRVVASETILIYNEFRPDPIDLTPSTNLCGNFTECPPQNW